MKALRRGTTALPSAVMILFKLLTCRNTIASLSQVVISFHTSKFPLLSPEIPHEPEDFQLRVRIEVNHGKRDEDDYKVH